MLVELDRHRGRRPVFLMPVDCGELVRQAYQWGGAELRNALQLHLWRRPPWRGVNLPTFMPETA